jgi:phosphoribosylaminoimidazole-succinocarboxamide synthase
VTSVKNVVVESPATHMALGDGRFEFTDAYSVFDWGQMPDIIPLKGASLCAMGAHTFEALESEGIRTHYRGVIADGPPSPLRMVNSTPTEMAVDIVLVPELPYVDGAYDYDAYHAAWEHNYLIPLEIVFRNRVPIGSSLRRRSDPEDHGLDMAEWPDEPVDLPEPVVEFSTKYESSDRYLDRAEADAIAGDAVELEALEALAREVNDVVTEQAEHAGLRHEDGKIECAYVDGDILVADVTGTLDENRFTYDGQQVSKEVLRQHYKRVAPEWVEAVAAAKEQAAAESVEDWHDLCGAAPPALDASVVTAASDMYAAAANAYTGQSLFDAPALAEAVAAVGDL